MIKAFISSRLQELEAERDVAKETLESEMGISSFSWEYAPPRSSSPDWAMKEIDDSDMFILIIWKEYSEKVIKKEFGRAKTRGIPILIFIKEIRGDWEEKRDPRLQKFIDSISLLSWKTFRKMSEFRSILKHAVMAELEDRLKTPFLSHSHKDLYELGEDIASSANTRVFLLARSLILITGPRPYISDIKTEYETLHYDGLMSIVEKAKEGKIKFSCSYLVQKTVDELTNSKVKEFAKERLLQLFNDSSMTNPQSLFTLASPPPEWDSFFTFIVGDDRFAIWFKDPANTEIYSCISSKDRTIATALIHIFESQCKQKPLNILLKELQL